LLTPSILLEVATHMAMGVALGLAFAFILTHIAALGVDALIALSPENTMQVFVMTCVTTFGIGTTFTGIVFMTMKESE